MTAQPRRWQTSPVVLPIVLNSRADILRSTLTGCHGGRGRITIQRWLIWHIRGDCICNGGTRTARGWHPLAIGLGYVTAAG